IPYQGYSMEIPTSIIIKIIEVSESNILGVGKMMKKKIIFVTNKMIMGGIEKSLISLLEHIPKKQYDITILVMESGGELLEQIPKECKVIHLFGNEKSAIHKMWKYMKRGKLIQAFKI